MKITSINLLDKVHEQLILLRIIIPEWGLNEELYNQLVPLLLEGGDGPISVHFNLRDPQSNVFLDLESDLLRKVKVTSTLTNAARQFCRRRLSTASSPNLPPREPIPLHHLLEKVIKIYLLIKNKRKEKDYGILNLQTATSKQN